MNISKQDFVKLLNELKTYDEQMNGINRALRPYFCTPITCKIGDKLAQTLIAYLEQCVGDEYNTIEWWLYDSSPKIITVTEKHPKNNTSGKIEVDVSTPTKLYNYFVEYKN